MPDEYLSQELLILADYNRSRSSQLTCSCETLCVSLVERVKKPTENRQKIINKSTEK